MPLVVGLTITLPPTNQPKLSKYLTTLSHKLQLKSVIILFKHQHCSSNTFLLFKGKHSRNESGK